MAALSISVVEARREYVWPRRNCVPHRQRYNELRGSNHEHWQFSLRIFITISAGSPLTVSNSQTLCLRWHSIPFTSIPTCFMKPIGPSTVSNCHRVSLAFHAYLLLSSPISTQRYPDSAQRSLWSSRRLRGGTRSSMVGRFRPQGRSIWLMVVAG